MNSTTNLSVTNHNRTQGERRVERTRRVRARNSRRVCNDRDVDWHLAQLNIARLRAPLDDPATQDFVDALDEINALAEASAGFVWRLQTDDGNATSIQAFDDELMITNMSTWESIQTLSDFAYRSGHVDYLRRKREWFDATGSAHLVLWWVQAGTQPTLEEAIERLAELAAGGSSARAFTFAKPFPPGPHHG
jgi:hypothetical protein